MQALQFGHFRELRPGGTNDSSPAIYRRVSYSSDGVPEGRLNAAPEIGSTRDAETVTS